VKHNSNADFVPATTDRYRYFRPIKGALAALQQPLAYSSWIARLYLESISLLSRNLFDNKAGDHIQALVLKSGIRWPEISFAPRSVIVGESTQIKIIPHLGEDDQAALFMKHLDYEDGVFNWLEKEAADNYDAVIEIGANVGVYSVFFDALIKSRKGCRLQTIISFEPSHEAFQRFFANLKANSASFVQPFRAAIANVSGFMAFFEPRDHLKNGSLIESFANNFSQDVERRVVAAYGATDLEFFFKLYSKILIKMDVEGFEPQLLQSFQDIIMRYRPDLIIEVLPGAAEPIEALPWVASYSRYLITPRGLEHRSELAADEQHRDWLLKSG
jgi:FkbM family methyltransferase